MVLKRLFGGLFAGGGSSAGPKTKTIDPKKLLFTIPTLSDDISPLEPAGEISPRDLVFHEDYWRQLEFYPKSRLREVQDALHELKAFEAINRAKIGWRNVYVRRLKSAPIITPDRLETAVRAERGAAPALFTGAKTVTGRIAHGFTLLLGTNAWLYGVRDASGVVILSAQLQDADDRLLTDVFMALSRSDHLILVDWLQQMLLMDVDANGQIIAWRP